MGSLYSLHNLAQIYLLILEFIIIIIFSSNTFMLKLNDSMEKTGAQMVAKVGQKTQKH